VSQSNGFNIDSSMLELFKIELENHARVLEGGLLELESTMDMQKTEVLMRAAHSIKGAARVVGVDNAVKLAHSMEDLLEKARKGIHILTPSEIETLLKCNDIYIELLNHDPEEIPNVLLTKLDLIEILINELYNPVPVAAKSQPITKESTNGKKQDKLIEVQKTIIEKSSLSKKADPMLLQLFNSELESNIALFKINLDDYCTSKSKDKLEPMMRAAHSLKGASRIVNINESVSFSGAVEEFIVDLQNGKKILDEESIRILENYINILNESLKLEADTIYEYFIESNELISNLVVNLKLFGFIKEDSEEIPENISEPEIKQTIEIQQKIEEPKHEIKKADANQPEVIKAKKSDERVVRVFSENLNKILGLSGEILVQAKLMKPFSNELHKIKSRILELNSYKELIFQELFDYNISEDIKEKFTDSTKSLDLILNSIISHIENFENFSRRLEIIADKLYAEAVETRMKPFSEGLTGFHRMVREIAKSLNKKVEFIIKGENTRVDRDILEKLESPLNHLLRNSIDHGIEMPEERIVAGKPEHGTIILEARHVSGMLQITIKDDGRGIDVENLRKKVVERGFTSEDMAKNMSKSELFDFLFLPGFSTAQKVTEISGRGVGLDVVFTAVNDVSGMIRVESEVNVGTSFYLQLPLTLSIIRSLLVNIGGQPYAIPISKIDRALVLSKIDLKTLENHHYCVYDDENIGIVDAAQIFHINRNDYYPDKYNIVLISDRLNRYGIAVDKFMGQPDLVVMPLDKRLGRVPNISSGAILEDGTPVLIMDVDDLTRSIDIIIKTGKLDKLAERKDEVKGKSKHILVVDDSLTVREVERKLLENKGYTVTVAVDGIDGWNALHRDVYDLVISDVDMPRMNGIDYVKRIRADQKYRNLPVMIVSYKDREEDRIRGLDAGANYYLTKSSFHDDTLLNAVVDMIGTA
jgi:two-component system sensor histidine kinase and response regulator WspE